MSPVFLDTSGLVATVNADDEWHARAEGAWAELIAEAIPLVTTSLVLVELGDGLSRIRHRDLAITLHERLRVSNLVEIVQSTLDLEEQAWRLFGQAEDKEWGLTDCVSFAVMRERGVLQAFTADHHFEQAGFEAMLRG